MDRYVETTTDPVFAARRTVNGLLVSVAGLIAVAVANELVIAHPNGQASVALSLLLSGGPLLYLPRRPAGQKQGAAICGQPGRPAPAAAAAGE